MTRGRIEWGSTGGDPTSCSLDRLDSADMVLLARSFAPLRPADETEHSEDGRQSATDAVRFVDVASLDPALTWRRRAAAELLRVPIGVGADGALIAVDLKESAAGGMGPHGLVVGATGSGKSELLRTLVTTLAISHPPATLALLLADFKGGATFSGLATLPHIAGMVTNLEADAGLIDRFRDALSGELQRRQELLAAGKVSSIDGYQQLQLDRPDLPVLPRLLVIVDEFSELLSAEPDLAELFVTIGRIGRSIGIHLLLATQRLDIGRIRGLESHLSYRICLRTFSEAESREAIGSPAAYRLPAEPGWAFLLADSADPVQFRAFTVSRSHRPARPTRNPTPPRIVPFAIENDLAQRIAALHGTSDIRRRIGSDQRRQELAASAIGDDPGCRRRAVDHRRAETPARPSGTSGVAGAIAEPTGTGCTGGFLAAGGNCPERSLAAPIGLVDIPERQHQELLRWDFDDGNGNLLIIGTGRSGKSTAVAALLCSLAVSNAPGEIAVFCADFGGESLLAYNGLPHVAAVATRSDPELTRLVFSRLRTILNEREALFRDHRFGSVEELRQARAAGAIDGSIPGAVVVIIDGWAGLRDADPSVEAALEDVLSRGPGLGVHTVLTISAAGQLRTRLTTGFGGRIELRLGDCFDSTIDRQLAKALPVDRPGRALVAGRHYAQLALPMSGGSQQRMVDEIGRRWAGPAVSRVSTLPAIIRLAEIQDGLAGVGSHPAGSPSPDQPGSAHSSDPGSSCPGSAAAGADRVNIVLGVSETDLTPVQHSLRGANPHLLIYGDSGSGKTTLLRSIVSQLTSGRPARAGAPDAGHPESATTQHGEPEVLVVDYRRGLRCASGGYRWMTRSSEVPVICAAVTNVLAARLADSATDAAPTTEIYLLVDDYELVSSAAGNPLATLLPFLPHARDIGFHLILARRSGGAARAQYEPLLQSLGDLGTPLLLLSGAPGEGRLGHGLAPQPLPPGRAQFALRGAATQIIQIGWIEPQ